MTPRAAETAPASRVFRRASLGLLAAVAGMACATATNYLDPDGPRYAGVKPEDCAAPPARSDTVRVVTFNIEYAKKVEQAVAALRSHADLRNPDVLNLQEMDAPSVERIARELGFNFVYYPGSLHPGTKRDVGNAILSPWPIEDDRKLLLPHPSRILRQRRAAVSARVVIAGRAVRVYSIHFGSPLGISGGSRRRQAEVVLNDARGQQGPVIHAGDFNSKGIGDVFEAAGYAWQTKRVGGTRGIFSFDHVFARGFTPRAAGVARHVRASDHSPVWAILAWESP